MGVDIRSLIRPNILTLEPYRCARDDFTEGILLDANENTHGPSLQAISPYEETLELNRYPDPHQAQLKKQICDFRNSESTKGSITPANLCLGVGSDESIDILIRCVCTPSKDKLMICPPTYGMYSICAVVNDVQIAKVPLLDFDLDVSAVASAITSDPSIKLVYLTTPGNPTAKLLSESKLIELLELDLNALIIVDEAYVDFAPVGASFSTLVNKYDNLVVMQTLSKSFGLAGIRLGIAFASEFVASLLNAMKYPYNISSLTSDVGIRATSKEGLEIMKSRVQIIIKQRESLVKNLQQLDYVGKLVGGLDSNFVMLEILNKEGKPDNVIAEKVYFKLATENGVVVRFRGKELNCTGCLRITVGTEQENKILVQKFASVFKEIFG